MLEEMENSHVMLTINCITTEPKDVCDISAGYSASKINELTVNIKIPGLIYIYIKIKFNKS